MTTVLLFNFNGTIVDTKTVAIEAYNEIAEKQGFTQIAKQDVSILRSLSIRERCKTLHVPLFRMPLIGMAIKRRYQHYLPSLPPVTGIKECLELLRSHDYELGFTTSNNREMTRTFLSNNQLSVFQYENYTKTPFSKSKDIRHFIKANHLKADQVIYIGDELRDIRAAQKEGIQCVATSWGYDSADLLQTVNGITVVSRPSELAELLVPKEEVQETFNNN